eukprot:Plantae.Rhodophyta-Purpureofilum_apyrenoidigerum.ctg11092.p1 GENE.Plantae.Rhodophyta-Purpureofilum_apyrenoidigerum.ctg11092~~Plantae.Rhodophyta-Purpureofilum_apyrenoidigerum.ctg11092.p1  ORF type:complete len:325 (+),score=50.25 Plantae.Rhodophyta-Purpureofilum_apyrenoidigerum.ctg11092:189-1163(+)
MTKTAALFGALVLLAVAYAQIDSDSSCVLTEDKCTCVRLQKTLCVKPEEEGTCMVEECKEGWQCDCTGVDLCDIVDATTYFWNKTANPEFDTLQEMGVGTSGLQCDSETKRVPRNEAAQCEFEGQSCEQACLWSVRVSGQPYPCIRGIPISGQTIEEWYGIENFATTVKEGLRHNYINVRIANHTDTNQFYFCSIYSDGNTVEGDTTDRRRVTATINTEYTMNWEVLDDPADTYMSPNSTTLKSTHEFLSTKSDGFCVGPINYRLGAVTVNYQDLIAIEGLQFQAYDGADITTLDPPVELKPSQTEIGPIVFRPNCFLDCLATL